MSKAMNFKYEAYGDSILLKMKDWRRVTKFLADHGVLVTENFSQSALRNMERQLTKRAVDGAKAWRCKVCSTKNAKTRLYCSSCKTPRN
jgi:hypothetical protein